MPDQLKGSPPTLCLASTSPRRRKLLSQLGFEVQVQPVAMDESRHQDETPLEYCIRLAMQKNQAAVDTFAPKLPVVTADTIVVLGDDTLGKPINREAVISTLNRLSGIEHQVITAVAVSYQGHLVQDQQISQVRFSEIDGDWLAAYADSEEPYDKAGAYGIQGSAARWIKSITGSYSGIMGLPLFETARLLSNLDIMTVNNDNN